MARLREQFGTEASGEDVLILMSEGHPGATHLVMDIMLLPDGAGMRLLAHLTDMNIRGSQLFWAYNEHCGRDMADLAIKAEARDPEMVAAVNAFFDIPKTIMPFKAVTEGALEMAEAPKFD